MSRLLIVFILTFISLRYSYGQIFSVVIDSIAIEGNKKTKSRIMLRELTFTSGDSIPPQYVDLCIGAKSVAPHEYQSFSQF